MPVVNRIAEYEQDLVVWRHDLHSHPEIAFEETRTSQIVAEKLAEFGIEVHRGLAGTGVVGTLRGQDGGGVIGLRADMDALPMDEANEFAHRSSIAGRMHGCGHDGHTTMLLGAARYLAETRNFAGTVHFIFQPAEEQGGGGRVMIEDGLFERFPVDKVFGMHNAPGLPVGCFALRPGPLLASADDFEIRVTGHGAHAAKPHEGVDPIIVGAQIVGALQTIASRMTDPVATVVVSVTRFQAGSANNIIPETAVLGGTVRTFDPWVQNEAEKAMKRIAEAIASAHGARCEVTYSRQYPVTRNADRETVEAADAAAGLVGTDRVFRDVPPQMGAEDFSFMLNERPGAMIFIGNGDSAGLHHPRYDFNDEILTLGASYWARLVETLLPRH